MRPTRLGSGDYTFVASPDDVKWTKPGESKQPKKSHAQIKREVDEVLAGASGNESAGTRATRGYEYVVYPEASHRNADRAVRVPIRRSTFDLTDAKRAAKQMGAPAAIYSVSKGRFVGYIHPNGRYVTFR
jgi:hypothetical protein